MLTKRCIDCKKRKSVNKFTRRSKNSENRQSRCKVCVRKYSKEHYRANKQVYFARNKRHDTRRADYFHELKKGPCADCGKVFPPCVMDFDHVRGTKLGDVGNMVRKKRLGKERIQREIEKCDLVCANCHRLRTCKRGHEKHAALVAQWECAGPVNQ